MDNQVVAQLAANLIDVSARNTASYISEKIKASKAKKRTGVKYDKNRENI